MKKKRPTLRRLLCVSVVSAALVVLCAVLTVGYATTMVVRGFEGTAQLPADCAIVFGAAVYGQSLPGPAIVRRVEAAATLYKDDKIQRVILSGGKGTDDRMSEAAVMRRQAISKGIAPSAITLEENAHSTWENIQFTRPLTKNCESVVAISDQYHLGRIRLLASRQGWDLPTVPAQVRPAMLSEQRSVVREILAYIYYLLYLDAVLPQSFDAVVHNYIPRQDSWHPKILERVLRAIL